uniref:Sodium/nucleoside cotransporter n=1 Tax=Arion vulgaris TaxID=1028688 RepID=A0A0B7BQ73_9EUPU
MDYKSAHGKDNSGYQGEETALPIVSNDNELKKETLSDGQLNYIKDINIELNKTSTFDETEHYPNGNVDDHNNDQDLVLQKKEFDLQNANCYSRGIMFVQRSIIDFYNTHNQMIWRIVKIGMLLAFFAYFAYAMYYSFGDEGSIRLLVCTIFGLTLLAIHYLTGYISPSLAKFNEFLTNPKYDKIRRIIRWALYVINVIVTVTVIIVLVALNNPENILSIAGLAAFIVICAATSYSPAMINWHPVFWGFAIQFYFALMILKTRWGYESFKWLGDRITEFLDYSNAGASFVFGDSATIQPVSAPSFDIVGVYKLHLFAFSIMPIITFFSTFIAILYHLGVMQALTKVTGRFLSFCLATTPAESLNAAGNIFVSMTESPMMIRPYLSKMTSSELHAVMVGGFASIAGGVLGVYIGFGVPADHLLSASVMSAPAALAISKITYPEVEIPIILPEDYDNVDDVQEGNVIEAACSGAIVSGKIVAAVIVNVIAFLSLLKFLNATLTWFGDRVGVENLTFELICSYVLYPIALFMGTAPADCRQVAELVGIKTFTNEFIAYQKLSVLIKNRKTYNAYVAHYGEGFTHMEGDDLVLDLQNGTKLIRGIMSLRSEIISTYALCGFSNFGSMGILLGTLSAIAPNRKPTLAKLVMRAMITGNVACFSTACIAGLFFQEFD